MRHFLIFCQGGWGRVGGRVGLRSKSAWRKNLNVFCYLFIICFACMHWSAAKEVHVPLCEDPQGLYIPDAKRMWRVWNQVTTTKDAGKLNSEWNLLTNHRRFFFLLWQSNDREGDFPSTGILNKPPNHHNLAFLNLLLFTWTPQASWLADANQKSPCLRGSDPPPQLSGV